MARDPLRAVVVAYDQLSTFEFGIMVELFGLPRPEFDRWYELRVAGTRPGPLRATGGFTVTPSHTLRALDTAGTIVVPGWRGEVPDLLVRKLRRAYDAGARVMSVCSGAFVLAEAGLLDGKRATTHWKYSDEFRVRFPDVELDPDVLYVDEGNVLTSAGSAAGIDLGLHLIRRDFGPDVANAVARRLVVPPHRDGGQKQFVETPVERASEPSGLSELLDRLRGELSRSHSVKSLARRVHMSERTFARRFRAATGTTPLRWLQRERVRAAQDLLETTELDVETIANRVGFGDAQLLRLHFRRCTGTSPTRYRTTFRRERAGRNGD